MGETIQHSLLKNIERFSSFEDELSVKIENISIIYNDWTATMKVFGELRPVVGNHLKEDIMVILVLYYKDGSILDTDERIFRKEKFMGFEILDYYFYDFGDLLDKVGKILIYPKKKH